MKKSIKTLFIALVAIIVFSLPAFAEEENASSDFKAELQALIEKYNANGLSEEKIEEAFKEINDGKMEEEIQEKEEVDKAEEAEEEMDEVNAVLFTLLYLVIMLVIFLLM